MANILCYCGNRITLEKEDFGFDELECGRCGITHCVPETEEELDALNQEVRASINTAHYTGRTRVMMIDECGHERCLKEVPKLDDQELLDIIVKGYQHQYPEAKIFLEAEENQRYLAEQAWLTELY